MEYITSRSFILPEYAEEMADDFWFNMWRTKQWPYHELDIGVLLYWYESPSKSIVWKTKVTELEKFEYTDKNLAARKLNELFGEFDKNQDYFIRAPEEGVCLAYKVLPLQRIDCFKPESLRFPQLGWLRVNDAINEQWLAQEGTTDETILDEFVSDGNILQKLRQLNSKMAGFSPQRVRAIVSQTIRRDTSLVRTLKKLYEYNCQFPGCDVRIPKRKGGWYVEVAHIKPVSEGGKSVLGNLLVLCPNHHKELDYGDLSITEQTIECVRGELNGKKFEITLRSTAGAPRQPFMRWRVSKICRKINIAD